MIIILVHSGIEDYLRQRNVVPIEFTYIGSLCMSIGTLFMSIDGFVDFEGARICVLVVVVEEIYGAD